MMGGSTKTLEQPFNLRGNELALESDIEKEGYELDEAYEGEKRKNEEENRERQHSTYIPLFRASYIVRVNILAYRWK
jgi:hypothetical protein